jgi:hypothetical protein
MEPMSVPFAPSRPECPACGLSSDDLASLAGHVEHLANGLSALEQRQLRSHLFALLAAAGLAE